MKRDWLVFGLVVVVVGLVMTRSAQGQQAPRPIVCELFSADHRSNRASTEGAARIFMQQIKAWLEQQAAEGRTEVVHRTQLSFATPGSMPHAEWSHGVTDVVCVR